jgi:molybdate transport system ATP-binding protein
LPGTSWEIHRGQHWVILGPNGAGKTTLVKALTGEVPVVRGKISPAGVLAKNNRTGYVSFEQHQRLIAREEDRDASRFFSRSLNSKTTVYEMLSKSRMQPGSNAVDIKLAAAKMQIEHLLGRGIRVLSTGEMRKVQIARVLLNSPEILILDEPFDGLDQLSREELSRIVSDLMDDSRTVILVTHRQREILPKISHVLAVKDGKVIFQGKREDAVGPLSMQRLFSSSGSALRPLPMKAKNRKIHAEKSNGVLVCMKNVTVRYDTITVLDSINWTINSGENWVVSGPNGCGKTTLLDLITADNPQAYANEIYLFGKRRGSGESIWDIKQRTGVVSSEFQIRYRKPISAFEVVVSGFFDSVGLYRTHTSEQKEIAEKWMEVLGIANKADRVFNQLSYGEQRMLLLARSMVKMPRLLILDEPYQGLDRTNRKRILDAIDVIGRQSRTNIIYVTHYPGEIPACMTHMLQFEKASSGQYTAGWRSL